MCSLFVGADSISARPWTSHKIKVWTFALNQGLDFASDQGLGANFGIFTGLCEAKFGKNARDGVSVREIAGTLRSKVHYLFTAPNCDGGRPYTFLKQRVK